MLFEPLEDISSDAVEFHVKANLNADSFYDDLNHLEDSVERSPALANRIVRVAGYVELDDTTARAKLVDLTKAIRTNVEISTHATVNVESRYLNNTIANQNGLFTKNIERILKDANKQSFLGKIGSVLTAPVRAFGAATTQIVKGSLFSIGEAAIKPYEKIIQQKSTPITELVGKQSEKSIQTLTLALARLSGYSSTSKFRSETFGKIENLTDFSPKKVVKSFKNFEDNLVSILESLYVEKDSNAAKQKVKKYTTEIIEKPLETLFEMSGVGLRVLANPFRIRKRVELLNTIKEAESLVDDILGNMSDELKESIKNSKGVTLATGGIDFQKGGENTYFSANLVRKLTPGNVTIPVTNSYSNDESTLGNLYKLRQSVLKGKAMPLDRLLQVGVETGRNPDAAKMLATAMAVRKIDANKPIVFTGSSGGSALVEEVIGAAERAALKKIKGVGLTLPGFDLTRTASKRNYKTLIGDYDPLSISAFGSKYDDGSKYFKKALSSVPFDMKGLLSLGGASQNFEKLGTGHHLADFLSSPKVQSTFTKFAGTGRIDPGYTGDRKNFEFANKLYSESQSIPRTIGVLLGDIKALSEVAKGEYSFIDPGHPEYRRDNDFSAMTQNFEKLKVQGPDSEEYEKFLNFLRRFKVELTNFYEVGSLEESTIPKKLKDLAIEGKSFFKFREGVLQEKYKSNYNIVNTGFENKPLNSIPASYQVKTFNPPNNLYQLPVSNPVNLQPKIDIPELAGNAINVVKNTIDILTPSAELASNALGKVANVLGEIGSNRLEQRVEQLRGSSEQPLLPGRGEIVKQSLKATPRELGQIAANDIAATVKVISNGTEQIVKFADGTIKAGKAARDFILGFKSQGKTVRDLGDAVIEVSAELIDNFDNISTIDDVKLLNSQILQLKGSIDDLNGNRLSLPSSEINEERDNLSKLTKAVYDLSSAFNNAKNAALDISSIQTGDFDISKLNNALKLIRDLETTLYEVREIEKLTLPKGSEKLVPQLREVQNPIGRLKSGAYKGILAQLPQIKEAAEAGDSTAQGFINGLKDAIPEISEVANKSGSDFIAKLKYSLGIASPAKKLIQPGIDTIRGFILGIKLANPELNEAVADLASGLTKSKKVNLKINRDFIFQEKGREAGQSAINTVEKSYEKITNTINKARQAVKEFISGNQSIKDSNNYFKGFSSTLDEAKDKLGDFLSNFQAFGVSGRNIANLGIGAIGIFAVAKGVEFLTQRMDDLVETSRKASKIKYLFKDAYSDPLKEIQKTKDFANSAGLDSLKLLESSAQVSVGFQKSGYSQRQSSDIVEKLQKIALGRRFSDDETATFMRPIIQTASKNKFSLEEIQQQLADVGLYGAPELAAKATGFGNDLTAFYKAVSQGDVFANNGNLERFIDLMYQAYGTTEQLDPLVSLSARLTNNFNDLKISASEAIGPLVKIADPIINGGIAALAGNVPIVSEALKGLAILSGALLVQSLFKAVAGVGALNGALLFLKANGIKGVIASAPMMISKLAIPLAVIAGVTAVINVYDEFFAKVKEGTAELEKLRKEQEKNSNSSYFKTQSQPQVEDNRITGLKSYGSSIGGILKSVVSLDLVGVSDNIEKQNAAIGDIIFGSKNASSTYGGDFFKTNEQKRNKQIQINSLDYLKGNESDLDSAKNAILQKNQGIVIDPNKLKYSEQFVVDYRKALESIPEAVRNSSPEILNKIKELKLLEDQMYMTSKSSRNLSLEIKELKFKQEENKTEGLKDDLFVERSKYFLPVNNTRKVAKLEFNSDMDKFSRDLSVQQDLASNAKALLESPDYKNMVNSSNPEQQNKALDIKSQALEQETKLIELQINYQRRLNERRKQLAEFTKEELQHKSNLRKVNNEIARLSSSSKTKMQIFESGESLDSVDSKLKLAKENTQNILSQYEQSNLDVADNNKLYSKNLISTFEYQTNLVNLRKEQVNLEGQFNDSLMELSKIDKERQILFIDLKQKQKDYETQLKNTGIELNNTVLSNYKNVRTELKTLNSEILGLQSTAVEKFSELISTKFSSVKDVFGGKQLEGSDIALKSYVTALERLSGVRLPKSKLGEEEAQARLLYQLEYSKIKIAIDLAKIKRESLMEELTIQKMILNLEQQKQDLQSDKEITQAEFNLQKAKINGNPQDIKLAQAELDFAYRSRELLDKRQTVETYGNDRISQIKLAGSDLELSKLGLDLRGNLINNDKLSKFGDIDPFKNLTRLIDRNIAPFDISSSKQRQGYYQDIKQSKHNQFSPVLNITNNFENANLQGGQDIDILGKQIGDQVYSALQVYANNLVGKF